MKEVEASKKDIKYFKSLLLTSKRYEGKTDLLKALLKDGEGYSLKTVDTMIQKFMKGGK